jgi:hypothetical protein
MKQLHIESIQTPEEAIKPLMERYLQLLNSHDWSYEYSDDRSFRIAGAEHLQAIRDLAKVVDPDFDIYWEHSPFTRPSEKV